jgi:predicted phosphoadenosine phosphosulfate sulfurtransferase
VSFSGGKDSGVMLQLAVELARTKKRTFSVLFIDWEAQFTCTIDYIDTCRRQYHDVVDSFYWVALPLTTQNSVSQYQPEWVCWAPDVRWIRQPPADAIQDPSFFPFYRHAMTFEDFVPAFADWFAGNKSAAMLVGIRTDESLNRYRAISSLQKMRYSNDKPWTTASLAGHSWNVYPIYDWKTADIWTWYGKTGNVYNRLYDLMYQAGVPLRSMRICEPFGPEQRQGLWLYHILEPEQWMLLCQRVEGANSGLIYGNQTGDFFAHRGLRKPGQHSWKSYAYFLLNSITPEVAEHYRNKIAVYLRWYQSHGFPDDIPDEQEKDLGSRDIPSWRRICKVLLRNDYWCRLLSFQPTKMSNYQRYHQRIKNKRQTWGVL